MKHLIGGAAAGFLAAFLIGPNYPKSHSDALIAMVALTFLGAIAAWGLLP